MINDQLAASRFERRQVGLCSVQDFRGFSIGRFQSIVHFGFFVVPIGFLINHVSKISAAKREEQALARRLSSNPRGPAAGSFFSSWQIAGKNQIAVRIVWPLVQLLESSDLRSR